MLEIAQWTHTHARADTPAHSRQKLLSAHMMTNIINLLFEAVCREKYKFYALALFLQPVTPALVGVVMLTTWLCPSSAIFGAMKSYTYLTFLSF